MLMENHLIIIYIILIIGMDFTNCNSLLDLLFQKCIRYKHHQENFREILANGITPFGFANKESTENSTGYGRFSYKMKLNFERYRKKVN